jgi:hypothetical protein
MGDGAGELRFPVNKQHANFAACTSCVKRGQMQHQGGIFAAGKRDAERGKLSITHSMRCCAACRTDSGKGILLMTRSCSLMQLTI